MNKALAYQLVLAISAVLTVFAAPDIRDKTLVAWVTPANLTQRGGSVLTIEKTGGVFDAIVLGEIAPSKWMPGSDGFRRTKRDQERFPSETADTNTLVQIAIVYQGKQVTLYRNGSQCASYAAEGPERFGNDSKVLIGLRHIEAALNDRFFTGSIDDARIYGVALNAAQIAALKPNQPSDPKPLAWWDFEDGRIADRMKAFPTSTLFGDARIADGKLQLDKPGAFLLASQVTADAGQASNGLMDSNSSARALREKLLSDPYRAGYHFVTPEGSCMPFDPNGAIYWKGRYHLSIFSRTSEGTTGDMFPALTCSTGGIIPPVWSPACLAATAFSTKKAVPPSVTTRWGRATRWQCLSMMI